MTKRAAILCTFFNVYQGLGGVVDIDRDLYLRPGDSRTRGQHRFFQERSIYDTLRNSFQRTAREWNHLPDTTIGVSTIILKTQSITRTHTYNRIVSSSSSSVELSGVVADCFKFCGTRHARHTQLMSICPKELILTDIRIEDQSFTETW
jgi:hypothetical protein